MIIKIKENQFTIYDGQGREILQRNEHHTEPLPMALCSVLEGFNRINRWDKDEGTFEFCVKDHMGVILATSVEYPNIESREKDIKYLATISSSFTY